MTCHPRARHVRYPPRICQWCQQEYAPVRHDQVFCRKQCTKDYGNLEASRAKALYRELYYMVTAKGKPEQGQCLSAINRQIRVWRDEDRSKGVPPPPPPERVRTQRLNESYDLRRAEAKRMLKEINRTGA